ncbi:hypothetical protein C356_04792 [Cryptococcus neoformans c45]|nr:hypothetical protein C356_04792 [Cryptococcus neoformans var. grubii c45]
MALPGLLSLGADLASPLSIQKWPSCHTLHAPRLSCQRVNLETIMHEGLRHKITMVNKAMTCLYKESGPGVGVGEIKGSKLVHTS